MKSVLFALGSLASLVTHADVLIGTARNAKGAVVYVERLEIQKDEAGLNKLIRVEYKKPEGETFAKMTSDFSKSKLLPDTVFEDQRFKLKHTLRVQDEAIEFEEFKDGVRTSKKSVSAKGLMVAGQGFDNFVRTYSSKLAEAPQSFHFGVLSKMDFYSLTGYRRPSSTQDEVEYGIRASSWIVRLFANELKLIYDAKTMRLKTFIGRSNILNDKGEPQDVTISYDWKEGA